MGRLAKSWPAASAEGATASAGEAPQKLQTTHHCFRRYGSCFQDLPTSRPRAILQDPAGILASNMFEGLQTPEQQSPRAESRGSTRAESEAKRRKIRKGTRSCWECKRRKVRCNFASDADHVCNGCNHRGTKCISQEYPEEAHESTDRSRQMGDRIVRVEALVKQLVKTVGSAANRGIDTSLPSPPQSNSDSAPPLPVNPPAQVTPVLARTSPSNLCRYEVVSAALCAAYPPKEDMDLLFQSAAARDVFFNQLLWVPYSIIKSKGLQRTKELFSLPDPKTHPVLIAKRMLQLATVLQTFSQSADPELTKLARRPWEWGQKLAETATSLVTTNDEFFGTYEGLECVILEAVFQGNSGNLRRSWLTMRRAMVIAQLMGLHRSAQEQPVKALEPNVAIYPRHVWFRILYADRIQCLMLGLPPGSHDRSMCSPASMADDTPQGRIERAHTVISVKMLERIETDPNSEDYALTQALDLELQAAAKHLPGRWWLAPNLAMEGGTLEDRFWDTVQLWEQLYHYHLLNHLHLPYMLRLSSAANEDLRAKYEYSKATCVTAAREILSRFVLYRSYNRVAFCCRTIDFYALKAALTLLLAHLDGHRQPMGGNQLAHHRMSDRAMMEDVLAQMDMVSMESCDALSANSSTLLRRLLDIEAEAAEGGRRYQTSPLSGLDVDQPGEENVLRISVPYFGLVKIAPEGVISKVAAPLRSLDSVEMCDRHEWEDENAAPYGLGTATRPSPVSAEAEGGAVTTSGTPSVLPPPQVNPTPPSTEPPQPQPQQENICHESLPGGGPGLEPTGFAPQFTTTDNNMLQQYDYPALIASAEYVMPHFP